MPQEIAPALEAGKRNLSLDRSAVTVTLYRSGKGYAATLRSWREREDGALAPDITICIPGSLADGLAEDIADVIGDPRCSAAFI